MSTAMTSQPWEANWAASGRPIFPAPTTATVPAVPGLANPWRYPADVAVETRSFGQPDRAPVHARRVRRTVSDMPWLGIGGRAVGEIDRVAFGGGLQQAGYDMQRPKAILAIDWRASPVSSGLQERVELGCQWLVARNVDGHDIALEGRCVTVDGIARLLASALVNVRRWVR